MSEMMSDYSRAVLRNEVLNVRVKLRRAKERFTELAAQSESVRLELAQYCIQIMDLQKAAGDPIEIDPTMGSDDIFGLAQKVTLPTPWPGSNPNKTTPPDSQGRY